MLEGLFAGILSVLANVLYVDLKRKGKSGLGHPLLDGHASDLALAPDDVKEGSAPAIEEPPDDAAAILAEIRRDRQLRSGPDGLKRGPGPRLGNGS